CCRLTCLLVSVCSPPVPCSVPLLLGLDEFAEVGVQLALLVDPPLLQAVPPFLLGYPQSAGNVVAEVQTLLLRQVADGLVVVLHLQVTLTHEEVSFDRLAVQLQSVSAVGQSFVVLLQLHVAQRSVGVVPAPRHSVLTHDGFAVAGSSFQVLAAQKQAVPLLLQLLSRHRGALLRAFRHLVHQARCSGGSCPFTLLPYPDARIGRAGRKLRRQEPKNR
uniref:Uncharacterized protein n=1 Tax=Sparus aurata TaxID=8175 RepID=A0A671VY94_SPAAU